ncbi:MAG: ATP-binding cassette domain-containing protein [SAR324 cluster bacterium]|nr:ATP-binding cassette domain-containing protein [SAR324 cluster bacterium]
MSGAEYNLLEVRNLMKSFAISKGVFGTNKGYLKAVNDVSFDLQKGESLGIVGESGSGKTTLGRCLIRGIKPTNGSILFRTVDRTMDLSSVDDRTIRNVRKHFHMIFQDPYSSLNPTMNVLELVKEPLIYNDLATGERANELVFSMLEEVGLEKKHAHRYAHAFSGGQRQRIGIARSLITKPELIICDEPVSALDVSVQAQILNLLELLKNKFGLTYIFISHDLSVIKHITDRVAVMYVGKIIEIARTDSLFDKPHHPYTEALLSAVPIPDPSHQSKKIILSGEIPNPVSPPKGCFFHPRCRYAQPKCTTEMPVLKSHGNQHYSACHFSDQFGSK